MPRRYRPPSRRRKPKRERLPEETEAPSHPDAVAPTPPPPPVRAHVGVDRERPAEAQHIARDHSYVPDELRLIGIIVTFITVGLIVTAILR